tara:strand:- start:10251 stop:10505 length:255 start_codon:yes stop_codon:yes gene_type:complete
MKIVNHKEYTSANTGEWWRDTLDRDEALVVSKRQSYGRTLYDPENRVAHYFLRLQGGKTLTRDTLEIAFKLGFNPEIKQEEITF